MIHSVSIGLEWSMSTATQGKRERNRRRWFERIGAWKQSGLSQRAFVQQHGLNEASFYRWRRIVHAESGGTPTSRDRSCGISAAPCSSFVPLEIVHRSAPADCGVVLMLEGDIRIGLEPGFDAATLERVLGESRGSR